MPVAAHSMALVTSKSSKGCKKLNQLLTKVSETITFGSVGLKTSLPRPARETSRTLLELKTMPLTRAERKDRMPFGAQRRVAAAEKVSESYVSEVMNGVVFARTPRGTKTLQRVQRALAKELGVDVAEAFPVESLSSSAIPA